MRRDFGAKNNYVPSTNYERRPTYAPEQNHYLQEVRQGEQLARQLKDDYDIAYADLPESQVSYDNVVPLNLPELGNRDLVIFDRKQEIVDTVKANRITIVKADTGTGKSTQIAQFLYEAGMSVGQTQPRRIAASSVAERISDEIYEKWKGAVPRDISAYQTAIKNTTTENTRIANVTDGLQYARHAGGVRSEPGHVIIVDEVHERNWNIEMEIAYIREMVAENPDARFVLQSATMDIKKLQEYYEDVLGEKPPVIELEGRTHDVEIREFPDSKVVERVIARATEMYELDLKQKAMVAAGYKGPLMPTDIIVACPGEREILDWMDEVEDGLPAEVAQTMTFLPLYRKLSENAQKQALRTDFPGVKIVFATDIAKTSLTIPRVAGIVDSGVARHVLADAMNDGEEWLTLHDTSRADCMQWAGRSGRVAPGWYDLTRPDEHWLYVPLENRADYGTSETQRTNPDRYVLREAARGMDFSRLRLFDESTEPLIDMAKNTLRALGALDEENAITAIGKRMNEFPLRPYLARMMVEADQCSPQIRAYMAAIVGSYEAGGLQQFGRNAGSRWKDLTEENESDLIAQLDLFIAAQNKKPYEQRRFDFDIANVKHAQQMYRKIARKASAEFEELLPPTLEEREIIKNCIYAGMPNSLYEYVGEHKYRGVARDTETPRVLSNRSVVRGEYAHVVAVPRLIESRVEDEWRYKSIIETVTVVDKLSALARVALGQCEWRPTGPITWRDGKPVQAMRQLYHNVDIGVSDEVAAEPSERTRAAVIEYALEHPGSAQQQLRKIKTDLEKLWHLADHRSEESFRLTQQGLIDLITAATPADAIDPSLVDNKLRELNLTIDDYLSPEKRQQIIDNAPEVISVAGIELELAYQSGKPLVRRFDKNTLRQLTDEVYLPDGRQVRFVYERKAYSLTELQQILR